MTRPIIIYNLFPRLVGHMGRWPEHTARARDMGFDWVYINPVQYPGFSGSLYAVKDYHRINPVFVEPGSEDPHQDLRRTLAQIHDQGLRVMIDLVINHTAKDSVLVEQHPQWFCHDEQGELVSPSAIDPADTRKVTVWGDLAEVDHEGSADREGLWAYFTDLVLHLLDLGFDGFRCDAAYKVPPALWEVLVAAAREKHEGVVFAAETLGCRLAEVRWLEGVGLDYLFNSSKYWNFDATWALEQHDEFGALAPSVAFPESHDTPRLMAETGGQVQVQKQRYAFAALFSAGLMMPVGFEYGFTKKLDVVHTSPDDWEDTGLDLSAFIREVNRLKASVPVLGEEGQWEVATTLDGPTTLLCKRSRGEAEPVLVAINKDWHQPQTVTLPPLDGYLGGPARLVPLCREDPIPRPLPSGEALNLEPAEVVLILK